MKSDIAPNFVVDNDLTKDQVYSVIASALKFEQNRHFNKDLDGKSVAVIFDKNSTRTRVSFEVGIYELGGNSIILNKENSQMSRGESIYDTAKVLESMVDMIVWRTYMQKDLEEMAHIANVPVINALTDDFHPCQVLADLSTWIWKLITVDKALANCDNIGQIDTAKLYQKINCVLDSKTLVYYGDGSNNMAHSFLIGCANLGVNVRIICPSEYRPKKHIYETAKQLAAQNNSTITVDDNVSNSSVDADVIVTDTWHSMGADHQTKNLLEIFSKYQVNKKIIDNAKDNVMFLHCLPAYRGEEVTKDVIDGDKSFVFKEAQFRLHAQKALMSYLIKS